MGMILDTRFRAGDLFDGLSGEEDGNVDRELEIRGNPGLEAIVEGFNEILSIDYNFGECFYEKYCLRLSPKYITAKDISMFSSIIHKYEYNDKFYIKAGLYLSALINNSCDEEFELHLTNLTTHLGHLGSRNDKSIRINGDVGTYLGTGMKGGKIHIIGNAEEYLGNHMKDGVIILDGNSFFGPICTYMSGGEVHLNGEYESISQSIQGGNVFHKGHQLIKNGNAINYWSVKWGG